MASILKFLFMAVLPAAVNGAGVRARTSQNLKQKQASAVGSSLSQTLLQESRSSAKLNGADGSSSYTSEQGAVAGLAWTPTFYAPQLTPTEFLIISSPSQAKVVYTEMKNFKSKYGRTYALVDSGLSQPNGLAFDRDRGHLYVADTGAQAIYRYTVVVSKNYERDGSLTYTLATDGIRLTILSGHQVQWVAVTRNGNVFYSDQGTKNINKITAEVMQELSDGQIQAESLVVISEKDQEAESAAAVSAEMNSVQTPATDPPAPSPSILSIYEAGVNPHVSSPAGIVSDGLRLYWTNQESGTTSGSCVAGEANPVSPPILGSGSEPAPFPAAAISNVTSTAYGVAKSSSLVFFSSSGTGAGGVVYGVPERGGTAYKFATNLNDPKGLVWDGDNTVYVADQTGNSIYSFPSGRLMDSAPLTKSVDLVDPFGIAILNSADAAFKAGATPLAAPQALLFLTLLAAVFTLSR